ncbi:MAG: Gfo/Idh/MocA family oxidoreductase [Nonlabens sp.]
MIRFGIIGLGHIANKFAADLYNVEGCILAAAGSRSIENSQQFVAIHGGKAMSSYDQVIESREVDVVYIATPHHLHADLTLRCIQNGKAVLCEKPMGVTIDQVIHCFAQAREAQVFVMEGLWTRFIPSMQYVLENIAQGDIGEIVSIDAKFGFRLGTQAPARLLKRQLAGGTILDIGLYPIYLCQLLLGKPTKVIAHAVIRDGVDVHCDIILDYAGAQCNLQSSFLVNTGAVAIIHGEKGSITLENPFHHAHEVVVNLDGLKKQTHEFGIEGHGLYHQIVHVRDCLLKGERESPMVNHKSSLDLSQTIAQVLDQIGVSYADI